MEKERKMRGDVKFLIISRIPSKHYPSMRGRRHNVEVVTPFSLFPNANKLQTTYRIAL